MVVSLVAHGVVAGLLVRWLGASTRLAAVAAVVQIAPRDVERAPMTVALLDEPAPAAHAIAVVSPAASAARERGIATARDDRATHGQDIATHALDGAPSDRPAAPRALDGAPRGLAMRGPDLTLSQPFVDRLFQDRPGRPPAASAGRVRPVSGGTGVIEDRVTTVRVDRDGTAHFTDRPDFDVHWNLHLPTERGLRDDARELARGLTDWYADPFAQARVGRSQDVPRHMLGKPGDCDHWDDACSQAMRSAEADRHEQLDHLSQGYQVGGKSEITDLLMRRFVGDPYAARKRKLLDDSRAYRAALGATHRAEDLARSAELMQRNVEAVWRATADRAARRDALFALWDECDEGEGADGEAGQRARTIVIGWIRARLPVGAPGAYTSADLATYAARRASRQPFAPYE